MSRALPVVCVIDDEAAVRSSLQSLLAVAAYDALSFSSAEQFLAELATIPDGSIILADVLMPGVDGIELVTLLKERRCDFPVVIMTGHASVHTAIRALRAGAADFIEKPFTRKDLFNALSRARARHDSAVSQSEPASPALAEQVDSLSPREFEVMKLMIAGETSKIIARQLGISPRTVEVHRSHVLRKMEVRNLAELIHKAARLGIQPQPDIGSGTFDADT